MVEKVRGDFARTNSLGKSGKGTPKRSARVTKKGKYELLKREGTNYFKRRVRVTLKGGYQLLTNGDYELL